MFWRRMAERDASFRAQLMRQEHEDFLNRALYGHTTYPRIPVRRVDEGGFARLLDRIGSRRMADLWWARVLQVMERLGG